MSSEKHKEMVKLNMNEKIESEVMGVMGKAS